jgi:hypothetical protein
MAHQTDPATAGGRRVGGGGWRVAPEFASGSLTFLFKLTLDRNYLIFRALTASSFLATLVLWIAAAGLSTGSRDTFELLDGSRFR